MNKPIHQNIIENLGYVLIAVLGLANFIASVSGIISIISLSISIWVSIVLLVLYSLLYFSIKKRWWSWMTKEGKKVTISGLGKQINYSFIGIIIILWVPHFFYTKVKSTDSYNHISTTKISKPFFDTTNRRVKILVMPFQSECEYLGTRYDIGNVICRRLERLNQEDTLNISTYFFSDTVNLSSLTSTSLDSILMYHHADILVYGVYSLKLCENDNTDRICYNYKIDSKYFYKGLQNDTTYNMVPVFGLTDIRNGTGQERIDNIVYSLVGITEYQNKRWKKAVDKFSKIKSLSSNRSLQYLNLLCNLNLRKFDIVKRLCKEILMHNPSNGPVWNILGMNYYYSNSFLFSIDCFKRSAALNPDAVFPWSNLAGAYLMVSDLSNSKKYLDSALLVDSLYDKAWYNLGHYYLRDYNYEKAKESFEKAIQINPLYAVAYLNLGLVYYRLGDDTKALSVYLKSIQIDSTNWLAWAEMAEVYFRLKQYVHSQISLEKSIQLNPSNDITLSNLGLIFQTFRDHTCALEYYQKALKLNPLNERAMVEIGMCYYFVGDTSKAITSYKKILSKRPNHSIALYNLGVIHSTIGNKESALSYFEKALSNDASVKLKLKNFILEKRLLTSEKFENRFGN